MVRVRGLRPETWTGVLEPRRSSDPNGSIGILSATAELGQEFRIDSSKARTPLDRLQAIARRMWLNMRFDVRFLFGPAPRLVERLRYLPSKYGAILRGRRRIRWFGTTLEYDSLWTPVLLQDYPREVDDVLRRIERNQEGSFDVLDIGANVGQFASTVLGMVAGARVWSLEPNPQVLPIVQANADRRTSWSVLPFGCAAHDGEADFWFVEGRSGQGSVFRENAGLGLLSSRQPRRVTVALRRLSPALLAEYSAPSRFDLVKIDVEGAEREVLAGLAGIQWRYMLIELSLARAGAMSLANMVESLSAEVGERVSVVGVLASSEAAAEVLLTRGGAPVSARDAV